ncbi:MAG: hypothetical protein U5J63_05425 [Fodinibius sp.]|nr:hypothetical protein [Fodinibius sp.]
MELYIQCSKGTYIRTLADDLARELDSAGHLIGLRRTAIGDFKAVDALSVDKLSQMFSVYDYEQKLELI